MTPHATIRAAKLFDIDPIEALRMRYRYLLDCLVESLSGESDRYWVTDLCNLREVVAFGKKLGKVKTGGSNDITDEMIAQARDYPLTQLIEFKRGKTQCFVHGSKDLDMSYHEKTNTVRCFGQCCKTWDTIGVLMVRDGLSFPAAVLQLQ